MRLSGTALSSLAAIVAGAACTLTTSLDGLTEGVAAAAESGAVGLPEAGLPSDDASGPGGGASGGGTSGGGGAVGSAGAGGSGGMGGFPSVGGAAGAAGRSPTDAGLDARSLVEAAAPSCDDGRRNGRETDVDCGGPCNPCAEGRACGRPSDCATNDCRGGVCVDRRCTTTADCASGVCASGWCGPQTCTDGIVSGDETDLDCGGSCAPCAGTLGCEKDGDCQSDVCVDGACWVAFPG